MIWRILLLTSWIFRRAEGNWHEWWTYDGISGPSYWGVINPAWTMCNKGRQQSPIDVDPKVLVHDPRLERLRVDKHPLDGTLHNTGQSLMFKVDNDRVSKMPVNITGGPLIYRYQFEQLFLHWGNEAGGHSRSKHQRHARISGSEHTIGGTAFPGELQLYGFNAHLFRNLSEAVLHPHGVVGVAIMIQETDRAPTPGLRPITSQLKEMIYRGKTVPIHDLNLGEILPSTDHYMTYEGSTTYPGCWETVTWIVMNKPIYISKTDLRELRQLMRGEKSSPKAPLGNNIRPLQPLNGRTIRTNLKFDSNNKCPDVLNQVEYSFGQK